MDLYDVKYGDLPWNTASIGVLMVGIYFILHSLDFGNQYNNALLESEEEGAIYEPNYSNHHIRHYRGNK